MAGTAYHEKPDLTVKWQFEEFLFVCLRKQCTHLSKEIEGHKGKRDLHLPKQYIHSFKTHALLPPSLIKLKGKMKMPEHSRSYDPKEVFFMHFIVTNGSI